MTSTRSACVRNCPQVSASAREGVATMDLDQPPVDLGPLFDAIIEHVPEPPSDAAGQFQMLVSTIDYSPYLGRLAIGRLAPEQRHELGPRLGPARVQSEKGQQRPGLLARQHGGLAGAQVGAEAAEQSETEPRRHRGGLEGGPLWHVA